MVSSTDAGRAGDSLVLRSAVLLAAGTLAFVGFAACAGMLQRRRMALLPAPQDNLRRELRLLTRG